MDCPLTGQRRVAPPLRAWKRLSLSGAQACWCLCCPLTGQLAPQMLLLVLRPAWKGTITLERRRLLCWTAATACPEGRHKARRRLALHAGSPVVRLRACAVSIAQLQAWCSPRAVVMKTALAAWHMPVQGGRRHQQLPGAHCVQAAQTVGARPC